MNNIKSIVLILTTLCLIALIACKDNSTNQELVTEVTFFKVGETDSTHGESFILALEKTEDIEKARSIINDPENAAEKIISAKIVPQKGDEEYKNQDLNDGTIWSWRIEEFQGFSFNTIEILDGWPGYIEEDLNRWFLNTSGDTTHGFIGFWGYTIIEEINPEELK